WAEVRAAAAATVNEADAKIAARCRELGIPEEWRPAIAMAWFGRGENASAERRAELRRVAKTRIEAQEKRALTRIEVESIYLQTKLIAGGLQSDAAHTFLESLPTAEALMPQLDLAQIEAQLPIAKPKRLD